VSPALPARLEAMIQSKKAAAAAAEEKEVVPDAAPIRVVKPLRAKPKAVESEADRIRREWVEPEGELDAKPYYFKEDGKDVKCLRLKGNIIVDEKTDYIGMLRADQTLDRDAPSPWEEEEKVDAE
jgi:hypothetical protein